MKITLSEAHRLLTHGQVVGVPTETVYGLAASLTQPSAIEQIFRLKGRPANNPLIIHVATIAQIENYTGPIPQIKELEKNWPGPMTLVLPIDPAKIPEKVRAGLLTAAFRIPEHPVTRELLQLTGPLVMPSANLSGRPSSTLPEHVENDFGTDFPVLDGGPCKQGLESTILILMEDEWKIIRAGALSAEHFEAALGYIPEIVKVKKGENPICPGQLYRHYAPKAKLVLKKEFSPEGEGIVLGYSDRTYPPSYQVITLGSLTQPETIAENLYAVLRDLDLSGIESVYVDMNFKPEGLLATIAERLQKAAHSTSS